MNIITHRIMANKIMDNIDFKGNDLIKRESFIWGNIKPDVISKYKLTRHYFVESFDMIIDKINYLSSISLDELGNEISLRKFSVELGVVCHFLCDYFTMPHYDRWEFKHSMKKHVKYEGHLGKVAKKYEFNIKKSEKIDIDDVVKFILNNQEQYSASGKYEEDLEYSYKVCNVIVNMVLNQVIENGYIKVANLLAI